MGTACHTKHWILTLLVSSAAAQNALDVLQGETGTGFNGLDQDFDDGQYHPSATAPKNHIESVIEAFSQIASANYPYYTPQNIDIQALTWPSTLDIFGTTLTTNPSPTARPESQNTQSLTRATASSRSATASISTTGKPSSRSSITSATSSVTPTSTATATSSSSPTHHAKHGDRDGDRDIAIILGVLLSLLALAVAAAIFFCLWRRKRKTGRMFKPARCSVCTVATTEPLTSGIARSMSMATEQGRNSLAAASYFSPKPGSEDAAAVGAFQSDNGNGAERAPESVNRPYVRHQMIQVDPVHPVYGTGPTRLQKSNSSMTRGMPAFVDSPSPAGAAKPIELPGDDLAAISEMDTGSPARRASAWSANPFVVAEQEAQELPSASVASREAAYFRAHSRDNSRDFPPYADNPAVTIHTASATSSETDDLLDREMMMGDSDSDVAGLMHVPESPPESPSRSPPASPNWIGYPLSSVERDLDANLNPFAPASSFSNHRSLTAIPPAILAGAGQTLKSSPAPFSPMWRRNGHVPSRVPERQASLSNLQSQSGSLSSHPSESSGWGGGAAESMYSLGGTPANKSSPQFTTPGPSPLTPSRSNPSPHLRNRIAQENAYLVEPSVHYPSWSEISGFDFDGGANAGRTGSRDDGDDGWKAGPDGVGEIYAMAQ